MKPGLTSNKHKKRQPRQKSNGRAGSSFFHPKLLISEPENNNEKTANDMAEKVMRMPGAVGSAPFFQPAVLGSLSKNTADALPQQESGYNVANTKTTSAIDDVVKSNGQPLDATTKQFMESRFNHDFESVRIHNDELANQSAAGINALAYTHGDHIAFGRGQYQPASDPGKQLLAHELAHVVQQNKNVVSRKHKDTSMTLKGHRDDGFYSFDFGYKLDITSTKALITINIKFVPDKGVTAAEVNDVRAWTNREFMRFWDGRFTLKDPDGDIIPLRMKLNFVNSGEDVAITLHKGSNVKRTIKDGVVEVTSEPEDQQNWFVDSDPIVRAHELGHQLGMLDEYVDPGSPDRETDKGPGVFEDDTLMGRASESEVGIADVKLRHGERLAKDISLNAAVKFVAGWSDTYIVRSGDTMHRLAKRIYGDESKWKDIYELNKNSIQNYTLQRDQVLKLPPRK